MTNRSNPGIENRERQVNTIIMRERGTILVVDDDPVVFESLELFLEEQNDLLYANSGSNGLVIAQIQAVDLILLDVGMPDINGYDLCQMLKRNPDTEHIPVIFLTAFNTAEDEAKGFRVGAVDYIAKPINPVILKARTQTHMSLKLQRDYLEILVRQDALTLLTNRRGFDEILNQEWIRAARLRKPLSLILLDIDSFKLYNDNYGHIAGDECLRQVSAILNANVHRGGDHLFRYGGEEFAVLLPETSFEFVELIAERVRSAVESAGIPNVHSKVKSVLTISAGAATVFPGNVDKSFLLLEAADRMLYKVKNSGRNGVCTIDLGNADELRSTGNDAADAA